MFQAVILAGGFGTRLKSVSGDIPKPMVDVAGEPFLYRLMRKLEANGCDRIILSLGYRADYVKQRVLEDRPVNSEVLFSVENEPLGTGGGIKKAASLITEEKFIVLNGDSYSDIDFEDFYRKGEGAGLLISGVTVNDVSRYGTLELDQDKKVISLVEKGMTGSGIINSGIYIVTKSEILNYPQDSFSFEQNFVQSYSASFFAYVTDGYFIDIGIPEDYHAACEYFK